MSRNFGEVGAMADQINGQVIGIQVKSIAKTDVNGHPRISIGLTNEKDQPCGIVVVNSLDNLIYYKGKKALFWESAKESLIDFIKRGAAL
jgi:hypothetical protein